MFPERLLEPRFEDFEPWRWWNVCGGTIERTRVRLWLIFVVGFAVTAGIKLNVAWQRILERNGGVRGSICIGMRDKICMYLHICVCSDLK